MDDLIQRMKELVYTEDGDTEIQHEIADEILCEALERLDQRELVELFRRLNKWYA